MLNIRLAYDKDINKVIEFYKLVSDDKNNKARWHYGLYPTDEDLIEDINNNELYLLLEDENIVSAAVLKMKEDEIYKDINWKKHNPAVIHLLATLTSKKHQGYGRKLLIYLIEEAKNNKKDSVHLDIVPDNDDARRIYRFFCKWN